MHTFTAPFLSFSFYSHSSPCFLPVSPSKYFNSKLHQQHIKVFTLKPYLYRTYSFKVGRLYLPQLSGPLTTGSTVSPKVIQKL